MTRSRSGGPKNHAVNTSQMEVRVRYLIRRVGAFTCGGLVNQEKRNAAVVHAHTFLIK